jgi:glycerol-3-phosphate dehydrogenase
MVSSSGLITITGGKWTTFRKMGEDTIDKAISVAKLEKVKSASETLAVHGATNTVDFNDPLYFYGSDIDGLKELMNKNPDLQEKLHKNYWHVKAEVIWAVRNEMARTVEDFLARRVRMLFLDAKAAIDMAPAVAELMSKELGKNAMWVESQVDEFTKLANRYLLEKYEPLNV